MPRPEDQPAARQEVDGRGVLGEAERVEHRRQQHAGPEPDPLGSRGDRREDRQLGRQVAVVDEVVLAGPERVEAGGRSASTPYSTASR